MALEVYKKGQGTVARLSTYVACAVLIVFGVIRLYAAINVPQKHVFVRDVPFLGDLTLYKAVAIVVGTVALLALHALLNRPRSVDLLVETEQEMKKVSWPTLPEVWNATLVVAMVTLVLALSMYGLDEVLRKVLFLVIGRPQEAAGTA